MTTSLIASTLEQTQGVPAETKETLLKSFETFFTQTNEWKEKAATLVITDISQKEDMKQAKVARLALKNIRVQTEHTRKSLKEESLRTGQTIDAIAKIITNQIIPIEQHLEEQEKFIERLESKRKQELSENRSEKLSQYEVITAGYDLGNMTDEAFAQLLENSKLGYAAKLEQQKREEEQRIEAEKQERIRLARMQLGNSRMRECMKIGFTYDGDLSELTEDEFKTLLTVENEKIERIAKEAKEKEAAAKKEMERLESERKAAEEKAAIEREKQEAELKKQRDEAEALRKELEAKAESERKAAEEKAAMLEAELSKGDREKMDSLLEDLSQLKEKYSYKSKKYQTLHTSINSLIDKTVEYARGKY